MPDAHSAFFWLVLALLHTGLFIFYFASAIDTGMYAIGWHIWGVCWGQGPALWRCVQGTTTASDSFGFG